MNHAEHVRLLCLDVDGVLTDGSINISNTGDEVKRFHVRDGAGIRIWQRLGYVVAIITGRSSLALRHRAKELGLEHVIQGSTGKGADFDALLDRLGLEPEDAAMIGDDLPDLPVLRSVGYPIAVADACPEVKAVASYVTERPGGAGAVRESIEHLLRARDEWSAALRLFG